MTRPSIESENISALLETSYNHVSKAVKALCADLLGASLSPTALARRLNLKVPLCHRVIAGAKASDALQAARQLPGIEGLRLFCDAALHSSSSTTLTQQLDQHLLQLAAIVESRGLSRERCVEILELAKTQKGVQTPSLNGPDEARRQAFEAMSTILGSQAQTTISVSVTFPSHRNSTHYIHSAVLGTLGIVRSPVSKPITSRYLTHIADNPSQNRAADPHLDKLRASLRRRFSSSPIPILRKSEPSSSLDARLTREIFDPEFTVKSPLDIFGGPHRSTPRPIGAEPIGMWASCNVPSQWLVFDAFLPRELALRSIPQCAVVESCGRFVGPRSLNEKHEDMLPHPPLMQLLGNGLDHAATHAYPRYVELLEWLFDSEKLDPADFVGYRVLVEYPLVMVPYVIGFDFA